MKRTVLVVTMLLSMQLYAAQPGSPDVLAASAWLAVDGAGNAKAVFSGPQDDEGHPELEQAAAVAALEALLQKHEAARASATPPGSVVAVVAARARSCSPQAAGANMRQRRLPGENPAEQDWQGEVTAPGDGFSVTDFQTAFAKIAVGRAAHTGRGTAGSPTGDDPQDHMREHDDTCTALFDRAVLLRMGLPETVIDGMETAWNSAASFGRFVADFATALVDGEKED